MLISIRGNKYELIEIFEYNNKNIGYKLKETNSSTERIVTSKEIIDEGLQVVGLRLKDNNFEKTFASKVNLLSITKTKLDALEKFKNTVELKDSLSVEEIETSLTTADILNKQLKLCEILNKFNEIIISHIDNTESSIKFCNGITYGLVYNAQAKLKEAVLELSLQINQEEIKFNSICIHSGTELENLKYSINTQTNKQEADRFVIKVISQIDRIMNIVKVYNTK